MVQVVSVHYADNQAEVKLVPRVDFQVSDPHCTLDTPCSRAYSGHLDGSLHTGLLYWLEYTHTGSPHAGSEHNPNLLLLLLLWGHCAGHSVTCGEHGDLLLGDVGWSC